MPGLKRLNSGLAIMGFKKADSLDPFRFLLISVARQYLAEVCGQIFEEQLDGWYRVPSTWAEPA
jgi:hypothetical protein